MNTKKLVVLTSVLTMFSGLAWQAAAKTPVTATPKSTMTMPGMKMDAMPQPGAPVQRVPIDQLPEATMSGPTRMGKLVMPPGMIMTKSMSMKAMEDMAAVDPAQVKQSAAPSARGDQPLAPTLVKGVKEFRLTLGLTNWNILPTRQVAAYQSSAGAARAL